MSRPQQDKWPKAETDLGPPLVEWLTEDGWDVYQEVQPDRYDKIADVVAVKTTDSGLPLLWVIEMKRTLGLSLLFQARAWTERAHFVSCAVPAMRNGTGPGEHPFQQACRLFGVGLLMVQRPYGDMTLRNESRPRVEVKQPIYAPLNRHAHRQVRMILDSLHEDHKTHARAGDPSGRATPRTIFLKRLQYYVECHPGCTVKEAIQGVKQHPYAHDQSAASCVLKELRYGWWTGVVLDTGHRPYRLFPLNQDGYVDFLRALRTYVETHDPCTLGEAYIAARSAYTGEGDLTHRLREDIRRGWAPVEFERSEDWTIRQTLIIAERDWQAAQKARTVADDTRRN